MAKKITIKSSVFASLLIFIYHGYQMATSGHGFSAEKTSEKLIIVAIICSSLYYYFLSISADYIFNLELENKSSKGANWVIEVVQLVAYFYIWDALKNNNLVPYAWVLFIINLTYILWDSIHWKNNFKPKNSLIWVFVIDIIGLVLSLIFLLILSGNLPAVAKYDEENTQKAIFISLWSGLIIIVSIIGILISASILYKKQIESSEETTASPEKTVVPKESEKNELTS